MIQKRIHLNGLLLIDCPASALNNGESIKGEKGDNTAATKSIRTKAGKFPYLSAQAFRYWVREAFPDAHKSPITREKKIAYTDANPIQYADDDIFGYMRAEAAEKKSKKDKENKEEGAESESKDTLTRISPFKVSTFVSIAPVEITQDFGVMSRQEGDPVPYEHEFYRATLKGLFSLDVSSVGRFYHLSITGYKHLGKVGVEAAKQIGLSAYDNDKAYQLSNTERAERIELLMRSLQDITGGAKQAVHYTDVNPAFVILAVTRGGNHLFRNAISASDKGLPVINTKAVAESIEVFKDDILSKIYVGLPEGYMDGQKAELENILGDRGMVVHPKVAIDKFIEELKGQNNWLD